MGRKITAIPELTEEQKRIAIQYYPMVTAIEQMHERRLHNMGVFQADLRGCTHLSYIRGVARLSGESNPAQIRAYLAQRINGAVLDYIRRNTHIPRSKIADVHQLRNYMEEHSHASDPEICRELGWTQKRLSKVRLLANTHEMSIDNMFISQGDGSSLPIQDVIPDKNSLKDLHLWETKEYVNWLIHAANLSEREQFIIRRHFIDGETQVVIADELGLSGSRIAQIIKSVLEKLYAEHLRITPRTQVKQNRVRAKLVILLHKYYRLLLRVQKSYKQLLAC